MDWTDNGQTVQTPSIAAHFLQPLCHFLSLSLENPHTPSKQITAGSAGAGSAGGGVRVWNEFASKVAVR